MSKKIVKPINPLIFKVAGEFAAVFYETGRSQGMTSKHKTAKAYARHNIEKFVPLAIKHLIDMLKPTSNCTDFMRMEIYEALRDPINDPDLMEGKKNGLPDINAEKLSKILNQYDKNKINLPVTSNPKSLKDNTALTQNPFTPKAN